VFALTEEDQVSKTGVEVPLVGTDGNAFAIMGKVIREMKRAGVASQIIELYKDEATASGYDNLLRVTMRYVDVV
jgi:hypothetical protein